MSDPTGEMSNSRFAHKLAERRRRKDMSLLFDKLKRLVPSDNHNSKATKGTILLQSTPRYCFAASLILLLAYNYVAKVQRQVEELGRQTEALEVALKKLREASAKGGTTSEVPAE